MIGTSHGVTPWFSVMLHGEGVMLKGIMKTADGDVLLSPGEVLELSQLLTPRQCELIVFEGESVLVKVDDRRDCWKEYWIGR